MQYKRYRIIAILHAISLCDIVCDMQYTAYDIVLRYRIRHKRYRTLRGRMQYEIVISYAINQVIENDIKDMMLRYRIIALSHAISFLLHRYRIWHCQIGKNLDDVTAPSD